MKFKKRGSGGVLGKDTNTSRYTRCIKSRRESKISRIETRICKYPWRKGGMRKLGERMRRFKKRKGGPRGQSDGSVGDRK